MKILIIALQILSRFALGETISTKYLAEKPKLVVAVVVDQLRADTLTRLENKFLPARDKNGKVGGFQYLMKEGAYFPFAEYELLQNMTGPGHSTVLSGAYPYQSGVPINTWFDSTTNSYVYCVEDASQKTIPQVPSNLHVGTSPKNFHATTVGDELKSATPGSRVVTIALKDRAAILMGGHRPDIAIWFEPDFFQWVSSRYYFPKGELPEWIQSVNKKISSDKSKPLIWKGEKTTARPFLRLDPPMHSVFLGSFPHASEVGSRTALKMPYGIELTSELVEKAVDSLHLGKANSSDLLAVSFSTHDLVAHDFGQNSHEVEAITLEEDKAISRLLNFLSHKVPGGLKNTLIVLTGDHGGPPIPEEMASERIPAGRIDEGKLLAQLNDHLDKIHGAQKEDKWVLFVSDLNFYLNDKLLVKKNLSRETVEEEVKKYLQSIDGIATTFSEADYASRKFPVGMFEAQVKKTFFPGRSGDVIGIMRPYFISSGLSTDHQTGFSYDRTVPLCVAGLHVRAGVYGNTPKIVDIAPTISFLLGIIPPSMSEGRVLSEILR